MVIYVQSRGISQENDYRWLKVDRNTQISEIPTSLTEPINGTRAKIVELIDSQKFSLVLARLSDRLLLLVTGLKARDERTDFTGRKVRNSIVWLYPDDSEHRARLRAIAVRALRGELDEQVDRAIESVPDRGFEVDWYRIRQISETTALENRYDSDPTKKIGKNSEEVKQELALELEANDFPQNNGLLVLVTSIKTESALKDIGVWRGLSNRVEYEKLTKIAGNYRTEKSSQKKTSILKTIALIASAVILILTILWTIL